jgi:[protein-PII] uridylyltransferase
MGFEDCEKSLGVEKMMKRYYRSVLIIRNITDILVHLLEQQFSESDSTSKIIPINQDFRRINQNIDSINPDCFIQSPHLLLEIFQLIAENAEIKGITSSTLRAIRSARYKITDEFRNNCKHQQLFIDFWHIKHRSSRALFLMKRSGILADYLIPFEQITGQMQFDMFHSYSVDEHTLFLLKHLTEFANPELNHEFPLCSEIMQRQEYPELIFLAGLFHDIAKGRGGDHSELGAIEAREFCQSHNLPEKHAEIIEWLVANHLLMSLTAQKRDISDPRVVQNFAELVKDKQQLELLYILTVADIRATSHNLWNSWKDSLLKELYKNTLDYLVQDENNIENIWQAHKNEAKNLLIAKGINHDAIDDL